MWAAFKALTWQVKAGVLVGVVAILIALLGSTYFVAYQKGVNVAAAQISRYELASQRLQNSIQNRQTKTDVKIVTEYKDRVAYVDRVVYKTRTIVEQSVPEQFKLSNGWIYVYNQSVAGNEPRADLASDAAASSFTDKVALQRISENNGICLANKAQLDSLQQWIRETEANRKEAVNEK